MGNFSSETDVCIPSESLETFHPGSVFSLSGDGKGEENGGLTLDLLCFLIQSF